MTTRLASSPAQLACRRPPPVPRSMRPPRQPHAVAPGQRVAPASASPTRSPREIRVGRQRQRAGLDAGEFEEVADHVVEAVDLGAHLPVVAVGVGGDAVLQRLRHGAQPGQRGAQVVRHPGDELPPGGLQGAFAHGVHRSRRRAGSTSSRPRSASSVVATVGSAGVGPPSIPGRCAAASGCPGPRAAPAPPVTSATAPATTQTSRTTTKSCGDRNMAATVRACRRPPPSPR